MALNIVAPPYPVFTDRDGTPLENGFVYLGVPGFNPETNPIEVFWDENLTIPAPQPIRTVYGYLSRNGTPAKLYANRTYSITVKNIKQEVVFSALSNVVSDPTVGRVDVETFTGDGTTTQFTMSAPPLAENNTQVYINGVYQNKDGYTLSGSILTFSEAPPAAGSNIEVVSIENLVIGEADASNVQYLPAGSGAVTTTVQAKLRETVSVKDFGAVGDGVTDDTDAWTDFLAATGSKYVPTGDYLISGTVYKYTNGTFFNAYPNSYTAGYNAGANMASSNLNPDYGNVLIGQDAGSEITTGYRNVAIGAYAHKSGNGFHNVAIGSQTLRDATTASYNVIVGSDSGYSITTGAGNCVLGAETLTQNTTGQNNVAVGISALFINTTGTGNVAVGREASQQNRTGDFNTAVGQWALETAKDSSGLTGIGYRAGRHFGFSVGSNAQFCTAVGYEAGLNGWDSCERITAVGHQALGSGVVGSNIGDQVAIGYRASYSVTGRYNVSVGASALSTCTTGNTNTAIGDSALSSLVTYNNCSGLGYNAQVTGSNQVQLGNSATTTYAYGAVQDRSDARDKTDVKDTELGLSFIEKLRPVDFRWDYREDYDWAEKDGSKKRNRFHHGLIAQEVKQTMVDLGIDFGGLQDHSINGGKDVLSIGYSELIAPLIKAVQELSARVKELESK